MKKTYTKWDGKKVTSNTENIEVQGHVGTWYVIDEAEYDGKKLFLLEHEEHGDETACIIVDEDTKIVLDDVWNGFDDYEESI